MNTTSRNAVNWFEISVKDIRKAAAFYTTVTGHPLELTDFGGIPHAVFAAGPAGVHGALIEDADRAPAPGGTVIYLDVEAVQAALDRAREAGGTIVQPLTDLGPHGTCALIADRDGNVIGLHAAVKA
jgi:predicted enzyme related to lactoylglutathione lyase